MLYIDPSSPNIIVARNNHLKFLRCLVNKKIGQPKCGDNNCEICNSDMKKVTNLNSKIESFLLRDNHIERIITGLPNDLEKINLDLWKQIFPGLRYEDIIPYLGDLKKETIEKKPIDFQIFYKLANPYAKQIKSIFSYTWLNNKETKPYNSFSLCKTLDRYTCTYCNRSYTSTIITEKNVSITRPTLDHWFPKSKFPLLSISFHNLIPSCYSCNSSVKGTENLSLVNNIHPYHDASQSEDFEFDYAYRKLRGYRITIKDTASGIISASKARNTLISMYIDEVYNSNVSELRDLLIIKKNYSNGYIKNMQKILKSHMSTSEVYRILFGTIYENENYHKRPLSKFKRDILKKLGMLEDV